MAMTPSKPCEVCKQAPAHVTCKADAASLSVTCDRDIHAANPLSRRHHRSPVIPFYDFAVSGNVIGKETVVNLNDIIEDDEAEAASWLIWNPNVAKFCYDLYSDLDPDLDLEYGSMEAKYQVKHDLNQLNNSPSVPVVETDCDGVVLVENKSVHSSFVHGGGSDFDMDFLGSKAFSYYNSNVHSLSPSVVENVAALTELATVGQDEETLTKVEAILMHVKNQTWPSGIQHS